MQIIVTGGRTFQDWQKVWLCLDALHERRPVSKLIHGDARGVDNAAGAWARDRGISEIPIPALWSLHGRAAGPMRNQAMLDRYPAAVLVAFPGGRGTADMVRRAEQAGREVIRPMEA